MQSQACCLDSFFHSGDTLFWGKKCTLMFKLFFLFGIFLNKRKSQSSKFAWKIEETISLQLVNFKMSLKIKINLSNQVRCS